MVNSKVTSNCPSYVSDCPGPWEAAAQPGPESESAVWQSRRTRPEPRSGSAGTAGWQGIQVRVGAGGPRTGARRRALPAGPGPAAAQRAAAKAGL